MRLGNMGIAWFTNHAIARQQAHHAVVGFNDRQRANSRAPFIKMIADLTGAEGSPTPLSSSGSSLVDCLHHIPIARRCHLGLPEPVEGR